jgi:7-keto-8-aminopelargonate synthetase-like enzyme
MNSKRRAQGEPEPLQQVERVFVSYHGRKLLYFSGCDYYRMASHPRVVEATQRGAQEYGLNVAASRLTTGNHRLYGQLESVLAKFFGAPAAVLVPTGYLADLVAGQALAGTCTHALLDDAAHVALQEAAQLLGAKVMPFRSRDPKSLEKAARGCGTNAKILVLTDGMFARDGSVAPLAEYLEVLPRNGRILVDDAHGAGVLGHTGKGTLEHARLPNQKLPGGRRSGSALRGRIIQTITLSKAFGVYGGAILGTHALRQRVIRHSQQFVGSTPLPLPLVCAALASLRVHAAGSLMRQRLRENADYLKDILRSAGLEIPELPGPIVCFLPRGVAQSRKLHRALLAAGIFPPFLRYPGGPASGYYRFVISSEHTRTHLNAAAAAVLAVVGS